MKKKPNRLHLNKETIRNLEGKLSSVKGACWSVGTDCEPPLCDDNQDSAAGCVSGYTC